MMESSEVSDCINELSRSVSSLQRVFDCPICLEMLSEPVRTTVCGHTFCKKCITQVLKSDCQTRSCPLCKRSLTHRSVSDNTTALKFLQLTLELVTAINVDTGINITEYRANNQSTNEASENSAELFKVKKTFKNKFSILREQRTLISVHDNKVQDINNKENHSDSISKKKSNHAHKSLNLKDYFLGKSKSNAEEKNKMNSVRNRNVSGKETLRKGEKKLNYEDTTITENISLKNPPDVAIKKQKSCVVSMDVVNNACTSSDVLSSDSIGHINNFNEKNLVSDENHKEINNADKTVSRSATNSTAMDSNEMCYISVAATRSTSADEGSALSKSLCSSSEQEMSNEYDKEKDFVGNLDINCDNLFLSQPTNVGNNSGKNVPNVTVTNNDDLDQILIQENAGNGSTERNDEVKYTNRPQSCTAIGDVRKKSVNLNDKVIDKNDDENVSCNLNVPFKLGDLFKLKDIGEMKVKRNQDSISLPFVLFGTLEINLKKRKLDKLIDNNGDENYSIEVGDIKKIRLFDSPDSILNEINTGKLDTRSVDGDVIENGQDSQANIQPRKKFYPSTSSSSGRTFKKNTDFVSVNQKDFIPSQSPTTDFDIFEEENNSSSGNIIDEEISCWDEPFESLSQCGLKSISQMEPNKKTYLKDPHGIDNVLNAADERSFLDNNDINDDCNTVINENIINKNKIKVCQREAINFKVPFNKTQNQSLNKIHGSKSVFTENDRNVSVNEIENSEPDDNNKDCLLGNMKRNADLNKNLTKSDQCSRKSDCNADISMNEIQNSEPVGDDVKNLNRFLNRAKQNSESGLKLVKSDVKGSGKGIILSKPSSVCVPEQNNKDIEKERVEIRKQIAASTEEQLSSYSEKNLRQTIENRVSEVQQKNTCDDTALADKTIINASDDDDDGDNINDSISATPPSKINSSGMNLGDLLSQRDKIKRSCDGNIMIIDTETNEIPSSLNDINCLKPFNSSIYNNDRDIIPSINVETTGVIQSVEAVPKSSEVDEVVSVPNSSQIEINENENVTESNNMNNESRFSVVNKTMSFVYSRLTPFQFKELKMFAFNFKSDITVDIIDGMTTHVIIGHEKNNRAPHTYKYLKGVASKLWVVSSNWVSDSLKAGKILPEENYLMLDPSGHPGPLRCRQPDVSLPLKNFIVIPYPPFNHSTLEQIQSLIILCGGEVSPLHVLANMNYRPCTPRILLMDECNDPAVCQNWLKKYLLIIVNIEWLLEVVGQYKLIPINPFMMIVYPLKILRCLYFPEEILCEEIEEDGGGDLSVRE